VILLILSFFESPRSGGGGGGKAPVPTSSSSAKKRKCVTFSQESIRGCSISAEKVKTKTTDGLMCNAFWFNRYIEDVFHLKTRPEEMKTGPFLARNGRIDLLKIIRSEIEELISRSIRNKPTGGATVMIRGGGNIGAIDKRHVPFLLKHINYLDKVIAMISQDGISPVMTDLRGQVQAVESSNVKEHTYSDFMRKYKCHKKAKYTSDAATLANQQLIIARARAEETARAAKAKIAAKIKAEAEVKAKIKAEAKAKIVAKAKAKAEDGAESLVVLMEDVACWGAGILKSLI